ncbi:hypothetical protein RCL1_007023 [Eukaryota sp. TZLM3-RCL]
MVQPSEFRRKCRPILSIYGLSSTTSLYSIPFPENSVDFDESNLIKMFLKGAKPDVSLFHAKTRLVYHQSCKSLKTKLENRSTTMENVQFVTIRKEHHCSGGHTALLLSFVKMSDTNSCFVYADQDIHNFCQEIVPTVMCNLSSKVLFSFIVKI